MFLPKLPYPPDEEAMNESLSCIFQEWYESAKSMNFAQGQTADDMVFDGFYPYYTKQNVRVLFIGREGTGLGARNYLEVVYGAYKENRIGNLHLNQYKFHYMMFYLAYALNHDLPDWESIPTASELAKDFATETGISFAFMNLSKLSSESGLAYLNDELFGSFVESYSAYHRNFWLEEITALKPDIVITMNLFERWNPFPLEVIEYGDVTAHILDCGDRKVPLVDMYHFSATKSPKDYYYEPLRKVVASHNLI